jgi:hypothetical protein
MYIDKLVAVLNMNEIFAAEYLATNNQQFMKVYSKDAKLQ